MAEPLGKRIQDLEKTVIINLKQAELAEHPHFYHGALKDPREPITLTYKVPEIYRQGGDEVYDPFFDNLPLQQILESSFPGVLEIKIDYDETAQQHRIQIKPESKFINDAFKFKYDVISRINDEILRYMGDQPRESKRKVKK